MLTIFDYFVAKAIAAYYNTVGAEKGLPPYLGEELFPNRKQLGLNLKWIKGAKGIPTVLNLSAFDANVIKKNRIGFEAVMTKMPFFKNNMLIDEELRQELLMVLESSNTEFINIILNNIFDDVLHLLEDAAVTRERMRMMLLSTGTIVMANNGMEYNYDYGLAPEQKPSAAIMWNNANSDPVNDIIAWQDYMEEKGYGRPSRAITSRAVIRNLMRNQEIRETISTMRGGPLTISESDVLAYLLEYAKVTVVQYDKVYGDEEGVIQRFIPEDLFILIPDGNLGNTVFGTTPEEADLRGGATEAQVAIVDTGVAITTSKKIDPVNVDTKVSMICLPSFEAADQVIIATVLED